MANSSDKLLHRSNNSTNNRDNIPMSEEQWIRIKKRVIRTSAVSGMQYNPDKFELRIYEHSGYTNVLKVTEDKVAELASVLNITPTTLILELDGDE